MERKYFLSINVHDRLNHPDGRTWRVAGGWVFNTTGCQRPQVIEDLLDGSFDVAEELRWNPELGCIVNVDDPHIPHPALNDPGVTIERDTGSPHDF